MTGADARPPGTVSGGGVGAAVRRGARAVRWYVRELLGESAYERYRDRHAREHPDHPPLSERDFWRARADARTTGPGCC